MQGAAAGARGDRDARAARRHAPSPARRRAEHPRGDHHQRLRRVRRAGEPRAPPRRARGRRGQVGILPGDGGAVILRPRTPRTRARGPGPRRPARRFTFARGDVVYLRDPSDPTAWRVRRLVATEGDWVTAPTSDDVRKVPKGHCWLERARVEGEGARRRKSNAGEGDEGGEEEGNMMVPVALLDARVPFVLWPPRGFGPVRRETPPGEVLVHHRPP